MKNTAMQWGNDCTSPHIPALPAMPGLCSQQASAYLSRHHSPAMDWKP
jgi:hypothetical protein